MRLVDAFLRRHDTEEPFRHRKLPVRLAIRRRGVRDDRNMPYHDDDDLFGEEFDFVDDDDESPAGEKDAEADAIPEPKPRRRASSKDRDSAERPKGRGRAPTSAGRRGPRPTEEAPQSASPPEPASFDDEPAAAPMDREEPAPEPAGPPADHVVHIYEYGQLKRTIPRKFTDEEAVSFAEEYTRTGKAYGRYAVATPEDEEPAPTFAGASRGR
jgi:hypothetical protein